MPKTAYETSQDAYLMPRDLVWKEYVDTWLRQTMFEEQNK